MPKICYVDKNFRQDSLNTIKNINNIVADYDSMGYELTLRQVYYQLVARGYIPNNERSYKNLGNLLNDARLAGLVDWNALTDRTRFLRERSHWNNPAEIIDSCIDSYYENHWTGQDNYIEVWVEKDALIDIVERACRPLDIPYFSCRGYVSQSEMWTAARRVMRRGEYKNNFILYLGDHDPSGIDMTRDIQSRMDLFCEAGVYVDRLALNMEQVEQFNPPPNPTKITDARSNGYIDKYGYDCWELDALDPKTLTSIIKDGVDKYIDMDTFNKVELSIEFAKDRLEELKSQL